MMELEISPTPKQKTSPLLKSKSAWLFLYILGIRIEDCHDLLSDRCKVTRRAAGRALRFKEYFKVFFRCIIKYIEYRNKTFKALW